MKTLEELEASESTEVAENDEAEEGGDAEDGVLVREHVAEVGRGGVVDEQLAVVAGREELARLAVPGECEDVAVVARVHGVR